MKVWEQAAARSGGIYTVEDFKAAAYALLCHQVIYEDSRPKFAYGIIKAHLPAFREVFEHLDLDVLEGQTGDHVAAIPRRERAMALTTDVTLLVLALRKLYDQQARDAQLTGGRAIASIEELRAAHKALTGRDLPADVGSLRALLQQTQRMGMSRILVLERGADQPFEIAVLPGIETMVSPAIVSRIAALYSASGVGDDESGASETVDLESVDEAP